VPASDPNQKITALHDMSLLVSLHLILHIAAGVSTLIAGPIAIFYNFKNPRHHRLAGKVFFYAMLYVCGSAVVGYFRHSDLVFYQFLLGIAVIVLAGIFRGVRAIRLMKGDSVRRVDWAYTVGLGLFAGWMMSRALWHAGQGSEAIFPILFGVFGVGAASDVVRNVRLFGQPERQHRFDWYRVHVSSMLGAFMASTTAFLVNIAGDALPWYLVWFGPTLALLPLQIYFVRKVKGWKKAALAA
jgi:hypothetical protein